MKVLFVTSEFADYVKTGGLADVSASLPRALLRRGVDVRLLLPAYPAVTAGRSISIIAHLPGRAGIPPCRIGEMRTPDGVVIYLVMAPGLYQRDGTSYADAQGRDWRDNDLRFARLSLAAAEIGHGAEGIDWAPDLVHTHDWPGGLAPAFLRWDGARLPTLHTIHNLAHHGLVPAARRHALGIPEHAFAVDGVEFHGQVSLLKAGIYHADHVSTVSRTYAREITGEAHGAGLHGLMRGIADTGRLSGIVNGIDESWNPGRDPHLPRPFGPEAQEGKRASAELVRSSLCLAPSRGPLFGIVSRLVPQKGLDLVEAVADEIVAAGGQIAMLGLGDAGTEQMLGRLSRRHRDNIGLLIGFNEAMAHRILAGSDFCLMPSRFEPCGLTQMHAQRYGALPIGHATGGLADTIEDGRTGFLFEDFSREGLLAACRRGFAAFADPAALAALRRLAMTRRSDWGEAAAQYHALYRRLTGQTAAAALPIKPHRMPRPHDAALAKVAA